MGTHDKIHQRLAFLMIFLITLLSVVEISSNNGFAQPTDLGSRMIYQPVDQAAESNEISHIDVGASPIAILTPETAGLYKTTYSEIYVVNYDSDSVSVISTENNTRIKDIPVGDGPTAIAYIDNADISLDTVPDTLNTLYVANRDDDTVSVINATDNTKIKDIPVGDGPTAIAVIDSRDTFNTVYVVNYDSDSVSVISTENNTRIKDIPVGDEPVDIAIVSDEGDDNLNTLYVANRDDDSISVISTENNTKIKDIPVGDGPTAIASHSELKIVHDNLNTLYVANEHSDSVSVISTENNTRIKDIPVEGGPVDIAYSENTNTLYVANRDDETVSVISTENNTKINRIFLGLNPEHFELGYSEDTNTLYVANPDDDTVSGIFTENNTKIKDIPVGDGPVGIGSHINSDTLYVANRDSNSISVIEPDARKVVAGVTFHVNPFNSGRILCGGLTTPSPTEQYTYVYSGDECKATPNEGFEFASWEGNLGGNATQLINVSRSASSLDSFLEFLRLKSPDKPEATLDVTKFGTFTANFREAPPPLPPEFWAQMYAVIATVITALFIPSIVGWFKSKREAKKLNYFHKQTAALYQDGKLDENDIEALDHLRNRIGDAYSEGKLNEKHYEGLRNETSTLYEEIFRKKINALNSSDGPASNKITGEQLAQIRNEIEYAYSKGKINEKHFDLLNKAILKLDSEESNNNTS